MDLIISSTALEHNEDETLLIAIKRIMASQCSIVRTHTHTSIAYIRTNN